MFSAHRFQWDKLLCWGIGIYAVMSLVWRFFSLYGFTGGLLPQIMMLIVLVFIATLAGRSLRLSKVSDILPYSMGWTLISILLDKILVLPIAGWSMYADLNLWVGYALILAVPLLAHHTREKRELIHIT